MATYVAPIQSLIPGFNGTLSSDDLVNSRNVFNDLTESEELKHEVSTAHLQNLAEMFVKHGVHTRLGIHLIHSHSKLEDGQVMLGHTLSDVLGTWNRPTAMADVNTAEVHGHIFKLVDMNHFVAYEFAEGGVNNLSDITDTFFTELAQYLLSNKLENVLGLQILDPNAKGMIELDFADRGTVMLEKSQARYRDVFRTTGWKFACKNGITSFQGSEQHALTVRGTHQVFVGGQLGIDKNDIISVLKHFDVIN